MIICPITVLSQSNGSTCNYHLSVNCAITIQHVHQYLSSVSSLCHHNPTCPIIIIICQLTVPSQSNEPNNNKYIMFPLTVLWQKRNVRFLIIPWPFLSNTILMGLFSGALWRILKMEILSFGQTHERMRGRREGGCQRIQLCGKKCLITSHWLLTQDSANCRQWPWRFGQVTESTDHETELSLTISVFFNPNQPGS